MCWGIDGALSRPCLREASNIRILGSEYCVPIAALPDLCCSAAAVGGASVTLCDMGEALG